MKPYNKSYIKQKESVIMKCVGAKYQMNWSLPKQGATEDAFNFGCYNVTYKK